MHYDYERRSFVPGPTPNYSAKQRHHHYRQKVNQLLKKASPLWPGIATTIGIGVIALLIADY